MARTVESTKTSSRNGMTGQSSSKAPSTQALLSLYEKMFLIRRFEEEAARAYSQGKIGGFLHLYIGQEAVAVGAQAALRADDYMMTAYRDHGHILARGSSPRANMAELYGKDTGVSRGLGGSMHMFDVAKHFYGGHAIVGGHVALAAGMAFKSKYVGEDRVTIVFIGDGATNIGGFHEGMSLAALWKLPCIVVCENNGYAMGTSTKRGLPNPNVGEKAVSYAMPYQTVDGRDVWVVKEAIERAAERARRGEGPTFLDIQTYRFRGHSMSDPGKYRTAEEVEERKKIGDPIGVTKHQLLQSGIKAADIEVIEKRVEDEIAAAVNFAEESPPAADESIHAFVEVPSGN